MAGDMRRTVILLKKTKTEGIPLGVAERWELPGVELGPPLIFTDLVRRRWNGVVSPATVATRWTARRAASPRRTLSYPRPGGKA